MPTFEQINLFYIALAVIFIPTLIGFCSEAGKDIYNKVRKKRNAEDMKNDLEETRQEFVNMCKQNRENCTTRNNVTQEIKGLKEEKDIIKERQRVLREDRLPRMELSLGELKGAVNEVALKIDTFSTGMKEDVKKLFDLWESIKPKQ